jgi:hypothetical protein
MNQHTKIEVFVMYGKGFKKCLQIKPFYKFQQPALGLLTLDKALQIMGVITTKSTKKGI